MSPPPFVAGLHEQGTRFPRGPHGNPFRIVASAAKEHARELPRLVAAAAGDRLLTYAAAIAFQSLIALIPLTLLGLGLLGAFGLESTWTNSIAPAIENRVTAPVFDAIDFTVRRVLNHGTA